MVAHHCPAVCPSWLPIMVAHRGCSSWLLIMVAQHCPAVCSSRLLSIVPPFAHHGCPSWLLIMVAHHCPA
eukprot:2201894-Pyramimonas_sp.AAC.1